jgi:hypothetical protein
MKLVIRLTQMYSIQDIQYFGLVTTKIRAETDFVGFSELELYGHEEGSVPRHHPKVRVQRAGDHGDPVSTVPSRTSVSTPRP